MSLIAIQRQAVDKLNEPRTSEKRAAKHRVAVRAWFFKRLAARGYTVASTRSAWKDALDMYWLEQNAES